MGKCPGMRWLPHRASHALSDVKQSVCLKWVQLLGEKKNPNLVSKAKGMTKSSTAPLAPLNQPWLSAASATL